VYDAAASSRTLGSGSSLTMREFRRKKTVPAFAEYAPDRYIDISTLSPFRSLPAALVSTFAFATAQLRPDHGNVGAARQLFTLGNGLRWS